MSQLLDVNVILNALRSDAPQHDHARAWFINSSQSSEMLFATTETLVATVRILTNKRIWNITLSIQDATAVLDEFVHNAGIEVIGVSPDAWLSFVNLSQTLNLTHKDVPDALLASQAAILDATLVTFDCGLMKYPGLSVALLS